MSFCELQQSRGYSMGRVVTSIVASLVLLAAGCGGGYSGPTGTVSGSVTIDGKPIPTGSMVSFISDDGFVATGKVEDGGSFKLNVAGKGPDIPTATYKVMVSAPVTDGVSDADADYAKYMESVNPDATGKAAKSTDSVPSKYGSTETSGLAFPVSAGENNINIELK